MHTHCYLGVGDARETGLPDDAVDLVFGSPPYEDARTYGIDWSLKGQDWVDWMVEVYRESVRLCRGLVAFVVAGRTRNYQWTATPALLMADLHRAGFNLRNPPVLYWRSGIPGSGGPDWLRSDYEWIICVSRPGRLPWSDNTACGHPPTHPPGGAPTHRLVDGSRVREAGAPTLYFGAARGDSERIQCYIPPARVNPGNVIRCSGGHLGSAFAHENEAPFPEQLAEFFVRSFCPTGGIVLDPFSGSGTTVAVAGKHGRHGIGLDVRPSQKALAERRLRAEVPNGILHNTIPGFLWAATTQQTHSATPNQETHYAAPTTD